MVFDRDWFAAHQQPLRWFLNSSLTRRWFRRCLRIDETRDIAEIGPSWYFCPTGNQDEYQADFRIRPKYARHLYEAFRPLWYVLHGWDWLTHPLPTLNLGFDSLLVYPNAHTETTTVDGNAYRDVSSETFSTIRGGAGSYGYSNETRSYVCSVLASTTTNQYKRLSRGFYLFDTSALTTAVTISAAVMAIYGYYKSTGLGDAFIYIQPSSPASNTDIAASDFNIANWNTTVYNAMYASNWSTSGYNEFTLNAAGRSAISKTGVSKFGTRLSFDTDNDAPTWSSGAFTIIQGYFAEDASGSKDPKLTITFTRPFLGGMAIF